MCFSEAGLVMELRSYKTHINLSQMSKMRDVSLEVLTATVFSCMDKEIQDKKKKIPPKSKDRKLEENLGTSGLSLRVSLKAQEEKSVDVLEQEK